MPNFSPTSEFKSAAPAWAVSLLMIAMLAGIVGAIGLIMPAAWRPGWLNFELAFALTQFGSCATLLIQYWSWRDGRWSSIRPFERWAITVVMALYLVSLANMALESFGRDLVPAAYQGGLWAVVILGALFLAVTRSVIHRLDDAKPRRRDLSMGDL